MIPPIDEGGRINEVIHIELSKECTMYAGKLEKEIIPKIQKRLMAEGIKVDRQALNNRIQRHFAAERYQKAG